MKRFTLFSATLILMSALSACGKKDNPKPTMPQNDTQPSNVAPSIMPDLSPTIETNIPDPTVNENSQGFEGMEENSTESIIETFDNTGTDNPMNETNRTDRSKALQK